MFSFDTESIGEAVAEIPSNALVETEQIGTMDTITGEEMITIEPIDGGNNGEVSLMGTYTNPKEAFLKVNTNCYAAPCPTDGHLLQALPANTTVWVVEKKKCTHNNRYYYYAGYNYNGASHRGYFCEDNVYTSANTRLTHSNVDPEKAPANYKVHTSKAGDVYDGPATTYSKMGSVGAESIKLIRTQGNFNFIEYTVSGTGKLKRGFLNYTLISGSWGTLTAKNQGLDGKVMYIANRTSEGKKYLTISSSANNTYATMEDFTGEYGQLFKFTYMDDNDTIGPYFYIQPVIGYDYDGDSDNENRRLAIQSSSSLEHDGRKLRNYNFATNRYQKFWVVKTSTPSGYYKIVPVSSYGTMDWNAKYYSSLTPSTQVVQSYTKDAWIDEEGRLTYDLSDLWKLEDSQKSTSSNNYEELKENWCWAVGAQIAASAETPFDTTVTQLEAVLAARDDDVDKNGNPHDVGDEDSADSIYNSAQVANYFMNRNINSGYFDAHSDEIYSEENLRKFIFDDHTVVPLFRRISPNTAGHFVSIVRFEWVDKQGKDDAPGYYLYGFYCPDSYPAIKDIKYIDMVTSNTLVANYASRWRHTVVFNTTYATDTISSL